MPNIPLLIELPLGIFGNFGYTEMLLFGVIAILLFGSRLPEVARNFGKSYGELKKHVNQFQKEFQEAQHYEPPSTTSNREIEFDEDDADQTEVVSTPKFKLPNQS